jgi:predicted Zn-dependent peptidase
MTSVFDPAPRPAVAPPAGWKFPVPCEYRPGSGVTVLAYHMPGQHAATVLCHLGVSAVAEPAGCDGIAAVTAAAMFTGARGVPAREFEQRAAAAGISWTTSAGWAGPSVTLELPARQVPAALDLLRLALAEPEFDAGETAAQIRLAAMGIARDAASPHARVMQALPGAVYGDATRAGRPAAGTLATVMQLIPDAITAFYNGHVRPAAVTVVIAGDLTGLGVAALAEDAFAAWRDVRPAVTAPGQDPLPPRLAAGVLVDQPGAVQTQLLLAAQVPGRGQPGWAELQVAARILGAPLTGRLDAHVRERSGQSYGLQAGLTELVPGRGLFLVTGAVDGHATPAVLADIQRILAAPLTGGFTDAEHADAAEAITRTLPLVSYETPAALAATAADLAASGFTPAYPGQFLDDIAALTSPVVNGACKSHLGQDRFTLVAVGDAAALAGPLEELAGPLEVIGA